MEEFVHFKSIFGIILGLSLTILIKGSVLIIQHPGRKKFYIVHFLWTIYIFLLIIHFWWWEINLRLISKWNFSEYIFLIFYILLFYMLCSILYPEDLNDYMGYEDYFYSRKKWFFSILAVSFLADLIDTALKGDKYLLSTQLLYYVRIIILFGLSLLAIKIKNKIYHSSLVVLFILFEILYIACFYNV